MFGGRTRPLSSPCVMITPPIMRVLIPQDVVWACVSLPASSWYWISNALAKLVPR